MAVAGLLEKVRNGLAKTRSAMVARITTAISGDALDEEAADEIEEILIQADVGVDAAVEIVDRLRERLRRAESGAEQIFVSLRKELCQIAGGGCPLTRVPSLRANRMSCWWWVSMASAKRRRSAS